MRFRRHPGDLINNRFPDYFLSFCTSPADVSRLVEITCKPVREIRVFELVGIQFRRAVLTPSERY
jgi:hypothetical protein